MRENSSVRPKTKRLRSCPELVFLFLDFAYENVLQEFQRGHVVATVVQRRRRHDKVTPPGEIVGGALKVWMFDGIVKNGGSGSFMPASSVGRRHWFCDADW